MKKLVYFYRLFMPFLYLGAAAYLFFYGGSVFTIYNNMTAAVIGLYGCYRLVTRLGFLGKDVHRASD